MDRVDGGLEMRVKGDVSMSFPSQTIERQGVKVIFLIQKESGPVKEARGVMRAKRKKARIRM